MTIYSIFPQPFFSCSIDDWDLRSLRKDIRFIYNRDQVSSGQTKPLVYDIRILDRHPHIKQNITEVFNSFAIELYGPDANEFILTTSWLTEIKKGDQIHYHNHNNAMFSGIFYYDEEYADDAVPLKFRDTYGLVSHGYQCNFDHTTNPQFHGGWTVKPEPGRLCFWRAGLIHYSDVSQSDKIRRSLAFNFVPIGEYGGADSTLNTDWLNER
tara:strand:+ start:264 stop:896 length:633 start_codon:yes stop_codon:yes gene_type:complete